jgi:ankyrin repeat protein
MDANGCFSDNQLRIVAVDDHRGGLIIEQSMKYSIPCVVRNVLYDAIRNGDFSQVRSLIDIGVNYNEEDSNSSSPLIEAIRHGHYDIAEYLILQQAIDVNHFDSRGGNASLYACMANQEALVLGLLRKGANPHAYSCVGILKNSNLQS